MLHNYSLKSRITPSLNRVKMYISMGVWASEQTMPPTFWENN